MNDIKILVISQNKNLLLILQKSSAFALLVKIQHFTQLCSYEISVCTCVFTNSGYPTMTGRTEVFPYFGPEVTCSFLHSLLARTDHMAPSTPRNLRNEVFHLLQSTGEHVYSSFKTYLNIIIPQCLPLYTVSCIMLLSTFFNQWCGSCIWEFAWHTLLLSALR